MDIIQTLFSYPAFILALFFFNKVSKRNKYLIYMIIAGVIVEGSAFALYYGKVKHMLVIYQTILNSYFLVEFYLFYKQLQEWSFTFNKKQERIIAYFTCSYWLITSINSYFTSMRNEAFLMYHHIFLLLFSIHVINQIVAFKTEIWKDYRFICCLALIIFCFISVIVGITTLASVLQQQGNQAFIKLFQIKQYVNILFNVLLFISLLCMPKKTRYLLS